MYRYEPVLLPRNRRGEIVTRRAKRDMTNNLLQAVWDGDLARVREMIAEEPEGVVRRCVLGPASEHSRRQRLRDLAPDIASFLV